MGVKTVEAKLTHDLGDRTLIVGGIAGNDFGRELATQQKVFDLQSHVDVAHPM